MNVISHGSFQDKEIKEFVLSSDEITVGVLSIGASIYRLITPDAEGNLNDIVLGYKSVETYLENPDSFGCLAGRFANRIAGSSFVLNGRKCLVTANEGENCLHGGTVGLVHKNFELESSTENSVILTCSSPDGESGFPGHLNVTVIYTLKSKCLTIDYSAVSDADTVINLTNHSYFNLAGHGSGSVLEHEIMVNADFYLPVNDAMIPLDKTDVGGTPFDLRIIKPLASGLRTPCKQIQKCGGYDHCYILNDTGPASRVEHPFTGRYLECETTEPGLQLYTANHIDGIEGKGGAYYGKYPAFCLETQHFPDSPNRPDFPSTFLAAGETFKSNTVYRFGTLNEN